MSVSATRIDVERVECADHMSLVYLESIKAKAKSQLPAAQAKEVEFLACAAFGMPNQLGYAIESGVNLEAKVGEWLVRNYPTFFSHNLGKTALHLASRSSQGSCIPVILQAARTQRKIDVLINSRGGALDETPLQLACARFDYYCSEAEVEFKHIQALLDAGADPTLRDKLGRTAIHSLLDNGHNKITRPVFMHITAIFDRVVTVKAEPIFRAILAVNLGLPDVIARIISVYSGATCPELVNVSNEIDGTPFGLACTPMGFHRICSDQKPLSRTEMFQRVNDRFNTVKLMLRHEADPRLPASDGIRSMKIIDLVSGNSKNQYVDHSVYTFSQTILPLLQAQVQLLERR